MPKSPIPHNEQTPARQYFPYSTHPAQSAQVFMIATPLGNLGDLSKRALELLQNVDELWCEDTRHTQALFMALKLESPRLRRVDQHISPNELEALLKTVKEKRQRIGVVSDAGTPGVSDPGAKVAEMVTRFPEIKLVPIPGPSAVTALMSVSGVHENAFAFLGFFPKEEKDQFPILEKISKSEIPKAFVFFESPHRIVETVRQLHKWTESLEQNIQGHIRFVFAKELTKIYETIFIGRGSEFLHSILHQHFDSEDKTKGEWCFLLDFSDVQFQQEKTLEHWAVTLECLISAGIPTKEASALISQRFSVAKNLAYKTALEILPAVKKK